MNSQFLTHYNQELTYIRRLASQFAERYPDQAANLLLGADEAGDPHVERLIESFAFLAARVRQKLDDDFPELTDTLIDVLYPHLRAPVPSMAIVQMDLDRGQADRKQVYAVPSGSTVVSDRADDSSGRACRFTTGYPLELWPIDLVEARLSAEPLSGAGSAAPGGAASVLSLRFRCFADEGSFAHYDLGRLRLFLRGEAHQVGPVYELLMRDVMGVTVGDANQRGSHRRLPEPAVTPVGFQPGESLLPDDGRSYTGYRLLSEYFSFPAKFSFVDIAGLTRQRLAGIGSTLDVQIYLRSSRPELERAVKPEMFQLNCVPVINLFQLTASEPIQLDHRRDRYLVEPDNRQPDSLEVYTVDQVSESRGGRWVDYVPLYGLKHGVGDDQAVFWFARREVVAGDDGSESTTQTHLSFVDLDLNPREFRRQTIGVKATCLNRNLPNRLRFGGGRPGLSAEGLGLVKQVRCLTQPTPRLQPTHGPGNVWRLLSHLSLNHWSLAQPGDAPDALRELLSLHDVRDTEQTRARIGSIRRVHIERDAARVGWAEKSRICRGCRVDVTFDEERFAGGGLFLFASVIERFLAMYCSVNSFVRMVAHSQQQNREYHRWPPSEGVKTLL